MLRSGDPSSETQSNLQRQSLADGRISEVEYEAAVVRARSCIDRLGFVTRIENQGLPGLKLIAVSWPTTFDVDELDSRQQAVNWCLDWELSAVESKYIDVLEARR